MAEREAIEIQFRELVRKYPSLMLRWQEDLGVIEGELRFKASFDEVEIEDAYDIRIEIPATYPKELPITKEIGRRIPALFHKNGNDILCLEVYTKMQIDFLQNPTLLFYVEKFIVEYLYGYSHKMKFGHLPYGERAHGVSGIIEFYKDLLNVADIKSILGLLKILSHRNYRGHHLCPCNNGKRLRGCHGEIIKNLMGLNITQSFRYDYEQLSKK